MAYFQHRRRHKKKRHRSPDHPRRNKKKRPRVGGLFRHPSQRVIDRAGGTRVTAVSAAVAVGSHRIFPGAIGIDREDRTDAHAFLAVRAKLCVNFYTEEIQIPDERLPSPERAKKSAKSPFFYEQRNEHDKENSQGSENKKLQTPESSFRVQETRRQFQRTHPDAVEGFGAYKRQEDHRRQKRERKIPPRRAEAGSILISVL